jgi:hypothetical protein
MENRKANQDRGGNNRADQGEEQQEIRVGINKTYKDREQQGNSA